MTLRAPPWAALIPLGACASTPTSSTETTTAAAEVSDASPPKAEAPRGWPLYESYARRFVETGRVVDITAGARSTSEGQAYGLFFALVANDRARFDAIASWTRDNLMGGTWEGLAAWLWGADGEGRWRVLDPNSATDADLWMAYAFLEAGRLWNAPELTTRGHRLAEQALKANLRHLEGLGPVLLPAPLGFEEDEGRRAKLNPSYLVPAQLERFADAGVPGPWGELERTAEKIIVETSVRGFSPDWVIWQEGSGFLLEEDAKSSYDAIRVPLFSAFGASRAVTDAVSGPIRAFAASGHLFERFQLTPELRPEGRAPPGFAAALLPAAHKVAPAAADLTALLEGYRHGPLYGHPATYYDQNLILFGRGYLERRFELGPRGRLRVAWAGEDCPP